MKWETRFLFSLELNIQSLEKTLVPAERVWNRNRVKLDTSFAHGPGVGVFSNILAWHACSLLAACLQLCFAVCFSTDQASPSHPACCGHDRYIGLKYKAVQEEETLPAGCSGKHHHFQQGCNGLFIDLAQNYESFWMMFSTSKLGDLWHLESQFSLSDLRSSSF